VPNAGPMPLCWGQPSPHGVQDLQCTSCGMRADRRWARTDHDAGPSEAQHRKMLHNTVTIGPEMAHEMEDDVGRAANTVLFPDPAAPRVLPES
jgi:hypothetical protein